MGLNQFSDWHEQEFQSMLGLKVPAVPNTAPVYQTIRASSLPDEVNWLEAGLVNGPKN